MGFMGIDGVGREWWMHLNENHWREIHRWLMDVMELLPDGPFPVLEAVPRCRKEWQDWYARGLLSLLEPDATAGAVIESLLQNPDTIPRVECGRVRYLVRERLRFALATAAVLADLKASSEWERDPPMPTDQAAAQVLLSRRRWLLVQVWEKHGKLQWQGTILTAAMATQAMAGWRSE